MRNPRTNPGTTSATGWPSSAQVVTTPVIVIEKPCPLPHVCPECGCIWEVKNGD